MKSLSMSDQTILQKLDNIERMLIEQTINQKDVLNVKEACLLLDITPSYLYKLTSNKQIPHHCPMGKKLYFERTALLEWVKQHPVRGFITGVDPKMSNKKLK